MSHTSFPASNNCTLHINLISTGVAEIVYIEFQKNNVGFQAVGGTLDRGESESEVGSVRNRGHMSREQQKHDFDQS